MRGDEVAGRLNLALCCAVRQPQPDLPVIEDIIKPEVARLVGDHVFRIEQAQQPGSGYFAKLLAQAAVGDQRIGRGQQRDKLVVAQQGQYAAVIAIHGRDAPEERQVGHKQLLHLEGDHQFIKGACVKLRRLRAAQDARKVGLIAGVVGNGAHAQEASCRGWVKGRRGVGAQVRRGAAQLVYCLRRGRVRMRQRQCGNQQLHGDERGQGNRGAARQARARAAQARNQPVGAQPGQQRAPQRIEHQPARGRAEEIKAGHHGVQHKPAGVIAADCQPQPQDHQEQAAGACSPAPHPCAQQRQRQPQQPQVGDEFAPGGGVKARLEAGEPVGGQQRPQQRAQRQAKTGGVAEAQAAAAQAQAAEFKRGQQLRPAEQRAQHHAQCVDCQRPQMRAAQRCAPAVAARLPGWLERQPQRPYACAKEVDVGRLRMAGQHHQRHHQRQQRAIQQQLATAAPRGRCRRRRHQQQHPGQPRRPVHLVDVADKAPVEAAARKHQPRHQSGHPAATKPAHEQIAAKGQQPGVQSSAPRDLLRHVQPEQRPVQGVEDRRLCVGKEGCAQEDVGVPQGKMAAAQHRRSIVAVRVEVEQNVTRSQHTVGKEQARKEDEHESRQQKCGNQVGFAWRELAHWAGAAMVGSNG